MLQIKAATYDDQLEWTGLVQSRIRFLIMNLERNQHIKLAHISIDTFQLPLTGEEQGTPWTLWFIGLEFDKSDNLNVDLTYDIQAFTDKCEYK